MRPAIERRCADGRFAKAAASLIYDPQIIVQRHPRPTLPAFIKMLLSYGRGRAEQFRLHHAGSALNFVPPLFCLCCCCCRCSESWVWRRWLSMRWPASGANGLFRRAKRTLAGFARHAGDYADAYFLRGGILARIIHTPRPKARRRAVTLERG